MPKNCAQKEKVELIHI